jgi:hypothetical protein
MTKTKEHTLIILQQRCNKVSTQIAYLSAEMRRCNLSIAFVLLVEVRALRAEYYRLNSLVDRVYNNEDPDVIMLEMLSN